jgi:hypothetical protein
LCCWTAPREQTSRSGNDQQFAPRLYALRYRPLPLEHLRTKLENSKASRRRTTRRRASASPKAIVRNRVKCGSRRSHLSPRPCRPSSMEAPSGWCSG